MTPGNADKTEAGKFGAPDYPHMRLALAVPPAPDPDLTEYVPRHIIVLGRGTTFLTPALLLHPWDRVAVIMEQTDAALSQMLAEARAQWDTLNVSADVTCFARQMLDPQLDEDRKAAEQRRLTRLALDATRETTRRKWARPPAPATRTSLDNRRSPRWSARRWRSKT